MLSSFASHLSIIAARWLISRKGRVRRTLGKAALARNRSLVGALVRRREPDHGRLDGPPAFGFAPDVRAFAVGPAR